MTDNRSTSNQSLTTSSWCVVAITLSIAHALSVFGMAYQAPVSDYSDYKELVNFLLWLSPVVVLLLFRKIGVLVCALAIPVSTIFMARAYYAYQLYSLGNNSVGQKGDWAWWLTTFTGVASVAILALCILYRIAALFVEFDSSRSRLNTKH